MTLSKISSWICMGLSLLLSVPVAAEEWDPEAIYPFVVLTTGIASTPDLTDTSSVKDERVGTASGVDATVGGGVGFFYWYTRQEIRADYHRAKVDTISQDVGIVGAEPTGDVLGVTTILYKLHLRYPFMDGRIAVNAGGGFGAAHGKIPLRGVEIDDWQFGYSAGAGVFFELWRGTGVEAGYRYVGATAFEGNFPNPAPANPFDDEIDHAFRWSAHEFVVSLQYRWGGS